MLTGSCFASEIGGKMNEGKMRVLINPCGTVYNPASIESTIRLAVQGRALTKEDLFCHGGRYLSFLHYTDFSSESREDTLDRINSSTMMAHKFLAEAKILVVTFGTARVYRLKTTGEIVSNCHKLPPGYFTPGLLSADSVAEKWTRLLDDLQSFNPGIRILFTVSPVRHWKDGAHGNQVSKSVLFLAIEKLLSHPASAGYFPAYELLMDDLRDYRYYADDMMHPSGIAVDYIWEAFSGCYLDEQTVSTWKEIRNITRAVKHRIVKPLAGSDREFAKSMLSKISSVSKRYPYIDFSAELTYFDSLVTG